MKIEDDITFHSRKHLLKRYMRGPDQQVSRLIPASICEDAPYVDSLHCRCFNSPCSITKLVYENEVKNNISFISEGLLKTYPTKKFVPFIENEVAKSIPAELQKLRVSDIDSMDDDSRLLVDVVECDPEVDGVSPSVTFAVPFYRKDNFKPVLDKLVDRSYIFGYDLSHIDKYKHDLRHDVEVFLVQFEARFTNFKFELADTLVHVSPLKNLKKIAKHGLVPRSGSNEFKYDSRVYLFNKCPRDVILSYAMHKALSVDDSGFCLLSISKDRLMNDEQWKNDKLLFYIDPMFEIENGIQAVFTYNNIRPSLINDKCLIFKEEDNYTPELVQFK